MQPVSVLAEFAGVAQRCELDFHRSRTLRTGQLSFVATAARPSRRAWFTLITTNEYAAGVKALHNSLSEVDSEYPLVVMVGPSVSEEVWSSLTDHGCELLAIDALPLPSSGSGKPAYAAPRFAECWTKLRLWERVEFDRIGYLDADMIVLKNVDHLLQMGSPGDNQLQRASHLQAVHECFCVVKRGTCVYHRSPDSATTFAPSRDSYFNAGLLLLCPSLELFSHMMSMLTLVKPEQYAFAEQDFLNAYFAGSWEMLPWEYNATKALYTCHRQGINGCKHGLWDLSSVRILHFTMAKPWALKDPRNRGFERLNSLWFAAFTEPHTLCRQLLQVHLHQKRLDSTRAPEIADSH